MSLFVTSRSINSLLNHPHRLIIIGALGKGFPVHVSQSAWPADGENEAESGELMCMRLCRHLVAK